MTARHWLWITTGLLAWTAIAWLWATTPTHCGPPDHHQHVVCGHTTEGAHR
jgi:hypothetical protein